MYNYYPEELVEEIRINNDIVEVVTEYVKLEKKGKDFFGLCPFHREKTPSFSVVPTKQIFYCFGCGKGGNVIHFIMNAENLDFVESVRYLADRAKIVLPEGGSEEEAEKARLRQKILGINIETARYFYSSLNSNSGERAKKYLESRGVSESIIKRFGLGYSTEERDGLYKHLKSKDFDDETIFKSGLVLTGKKNGDYDRFRGRIIFPIFDVRGNIIAFGGRVTDSSLPKYINSPETIVYNKGKNLYAMNFAKNSGESRIIVVEGYLDVISLHQRGIINTVASLGTALTESQGRLLKKYAEEIIISYDADSAGQAATMRGLDLLNDIGCNVKVLIIPEGKDPDEYIRKNGMEGFRKLIDASVSLIEYKIGILKKEIHTDTTEGRIKFMNKAADVLAKIDNNVEREMYIKKIAKDYGISEEAVFSEVYRRIKPKASFKSKIIDINRAKLSETEDTGNNRDGKALYDERFIMAMLCVDNSVYKSVREKVNVEFFINEENKKTASIIINKLESKAGIAPAELLNIVEKDTANEFSKIFSEQSHCDDIKKAILGKIRNIDLYRYEKRLKEILELLHNEGSLKEGDVERLKHEFKSLALLIKKQKSG